MRATDLAIELHLRGLHDQRLRMTAKEQRELFGGYVFGKKEFHIDTDGIGHIYTFRSVCFGLDTETETWTLEQVIKAVDAKRKL